MATRTTVVTENDFTGEPMGPDEGESVEFTWRGVTREIDLYHDQIDELDKLLEPYVDASRKVTRQAEGGRRKQSAQRAPAAGDGYNRETKQQIREWGRQQGRTVSERGRLPGDLVEEWEKAHQGAAA